MLNKISIALLLSIVMFTLSCEIGINEFSLDYDHSASNIILQHKVYSTNPYFVEEFDNNPEFTLYGDGRLIYAEPLLLPMVMYPQFPANHPPVYQPMYSLHEVYLNPDEVDEILTDVLNNGLLSFDDFYDDPNVADSLMQEVTLNLTHHTKTSKSYAYAGPSELIDIFVDLREYYNFNATGYQQTELSVTCQPFLQFDGTEPTWNFPAVDLDAVSGSPVGQTVSGQDMDDILIGLQNGRYWEFNSNYYIVYIKPLLP